MPSPSNEPGRRGRKDEELWVRDYTEERVRNKSLKDRIQESPAVFFLSAIIAGFLAGMGAYKGILEIAQLETISKQQHLEFGQTREQLQKQLDDSNQQNSRLEQAREQLKKQLEEKNPHNSELEQAREQLQKQLDDSNQQNSKLEQARQQLQKQLDNSNQQNSKLEQARQQVQKQLDGSNQEVAELRTRLENVQQGNTLSQPRLRVFVQDGDIPRPLQDAFIKLHQGPKDCLSGSEYAFTNVSEDANVILKCVKPLHEAEACSASNAFSIGLFIPRPRPKLDEAEAFRTVNLNSGWTADSVREEVCQDLKKMAKDVAKSLGGAK